MKTQTVTFIGGPMNLWQRAHDDLHTGRVIRFGMPQPLSAIAFSENDPLPDPFRAPPMKVAEYIVHRLPVETKERDTFSYAGSAFVAIWVEGTGY